jgi:hypothetical protein
MSEQEKRKNGNSAPDEDPLRADVEVVLTWITDHPVEEDDDPAPQRVMDSTNNLAGAYKRIMALTAASVTPSDASAVEVLEGLDTSIATAGTDVGLQVSLSSADLDLKRRQRGRAAAFWAAYAQAKKTA